MKKTKIALNKRLSLNKETITVLDNKLQEVLGGAPGTTAKACIALSGTGCGCDMNTCGIVICSAYAGCASNDCPVA